MLALWAVCEGLARYRFDLQNIWLPMALRDNLAVTALDRHRLVPNFSGQSRSGILFYTDELGFRCAKPSELQKDRGVTFGERKAEYNTENINIKNINTENININKYNTENINKYNININASPATILLGGDSIAFGMYQNYEDSLGFQLERGLPKGRVRVQALPGGSQALTLDHLFGPDQLAQRSGAQWLIHTLTNYDNTDNWLYALDQQELSDPKTRGLREIKNLAGPYFIQMLQMKFRDFLNKDERKNLLWAAEPPLQRQGASERAVAALVQACQKNRIRLAIVFIPDRGELSKVSADTGNEFVGLCEKLALPYFNLAQHLKADANIECARVFRDDNIHFSAYGAEVAGRKIAQWFMEIQQ